MNDTGNPLRQDDNRKIVERFWSAVKAKDWDAHDALVDDDYVQEWPQSGEGSSRR